MLIPVANPSIARARRGMGDAISETAQVASLGGSLAAGTVGVVASTGAIAATTASIAIPAIGIGVAAVMVALALIKNSGCGDTCIIASNDANKIEPLLKANLDGYMAGPRTVASQQQALANFDQIWAALVQACSNPALGDAGKRCISDRQAGACHYGAPPNCWNWFVGYRNPIADDPYVVSNPVDSIIQSAGLPASVGGVPMAALVIPAAILALVWAVS